MKSVIHIGKRVGWDKAYIDLDTKKSASGVKGDGIIIQPITTHTYRRK